MARDTVLIGTCVARGQRPGMAGQTAPPVVRGRLLRHIMRIVAGAAPQLPAALAHAQALRQFFGLADDFDFVLHRPRRDINRVDVLAPFAGLEVGNRLSGVRNADFTRQMALFADAVARGLRELRRIDDAARHRVFQMRRRRAVAAVATNLCLGKGRLPVAI